MEVNYLDGKQSDTSNGNHTVSELSDSESMTEFSTTHQYTAISEHSTVKGTPKAIRGWLTSLQEDFLASHLVSQESNSEQMIRETCGLKRYEPYAQYDQNSHSLKTFQVSLFQDISTQSSVTFTRWGTMYDGVCYQLEKWELHTKENACGYLPTPNAWNGRRGPGANGFNPLSKKQSDRSLETFVKYYPTPTAHMAKETNAPSESNRNEPTLSSIVGGQLNPEWVELLMGWIKNQTSLEPISHIDYILWLMVFSKELNIGEERITKKVLQIMQLGNVQEEIRKKTGRLFNIHEASVLLSILCKYEERSYEARIFMACSEISEEKVRSMRLYKKIAGTSYRSRYYEQFERKHSNSLQALSRFLAYYGKEAWKNGCWENAVNRITNGMANRAHRLKAIGNGQVSITMAAAFQALSQGII